MRMLCRFITNPGSKKDLYFLVSSSYYALYAAFVAKLLVQTKNILKEKKKKLWPVAIRVVGRCILILSKNWVSSAYVL